MSTQKSTNRCPHRNQPTDVHPEINQQMSTQKSIVNERQLKPEFREEREKKRERERERERERSHLYNEPIWQTTNS